MFVDLARCLFEISGSRFSFVGVVGARGDEETMAKTSVDELYSSFEDANGV